MPCKDHRLYATTLSIFREYFRYIVKLNASTGAKIWEVAFPTTDSAIGVRSAWETIEFTEDGGFIVGGFANYKANEFPFFKSSGQVDTGNPLIEKFSKEIAESNSMRSTPNPVLGMRIQKF